MFTLFLIACLRLASSLRPQTSFADELPSSAASCLEQPITPWTSTYEQRVEKFAECLRAFFGKQCIKRNLAMMLPRSSAQTGQTQQGRSALIASSDSADRVAGFDGPFVSMDDIMVYRGTPHALFNYGGPAADRTACASEEQVEGWVATADLMHCQRNFTFNDCILQSLTYSKKPTITAVILDQEIPFVGTSLYAFLAANGSFPGDLFAVNPSRFIQHPQVHVFPLGVYDAVLWSSHLRGLEARVEQRTNLLECNGVSLHAGRLRKVLALQKNGFDCGLVSHRDKQGKDLFDAVKLDPHEYAERMLHAKFVFSPRGRGQQNYRDWEALLAGAVPLMDAPPTHYEPFYQGLPIVFVKNWSSITPAYLEDAWTSIMSNKDKYDLKSSHAPYWYAQFAKRVRSLD